MAKYVTKNVGHTVCDIMAYDNNDKKVVTVPMMFRNEPTDNELKKACSRHNMRYLKVKASERVEKRMRMTTENFMAHARELKDGDSKAGLVTRTIYDTFTTLSVFNHDTEEMEELEVHMNVNNLDKVELVGKTACDIISRREVPHTYGMEIDTFVKYGEEF